jgi:hypothetical protein
VSRVHLYVLAGALTIAGLGLFVYKAYVLGFPLAAKTKSRVWNVEARVTFVAQNAPAKVSLFIPSRSRRLAVVNEHFISGGYGLVVGAENDNRQAVWSIRQARGRQSLYYQAVVQMVPARVPAAQTKTPEISGKKFQGPELNAANAAIERIKAKSADTRSFVAELLKRVNRDDPTGDLAVLLGPKPTATKKVTTAVDILEQADIPARVVQGIRVQDDKHDFSKRSHVFEWLEVFDQNRWHSFDPVKGTSPVPDDWFAWWRGTQNPARVEGGTKLNVVMSVSPKVEEGITAAISRGEIARPLLFKFSLFSLPVNTQAVYRVMLLIPIGAMVLVILRNIIGIKTFGTFMPVLIALAFRESGLLWGVTLFSLVVALGLTVRFYLERLQLLVVPRLSAVLIVVIITMMALSILTHNLGIHRGLSLALFPLVILTMTIERMSIVWEERGPAEALVSGLGSLLTAAIAFLIMNVKWIEHMVFVFPELLLVVLAGTLLLGRYSGYRLTDLYRFKALAGG